MTLRDLIHKIVNMPDWVSELPSDPTRPKQCIKTSDGQLVTDIYVNGKDEVIIVVEQTKGKDNERDDARKV